MAGFIYYTGIGANKNGKHTTEEFLNIMNKHFNIQCSKYAFEREAYKSYKPCLKSSEMYRKQIKYNTKRNKPDFDDNIYKRKGDKLDKKCRNYAKRGTLRRKCNLDEYVLFSGAENRQ
jgi:hypothetical protein